MAPSDHQAGGGNLCIEFRTAAVIETYGSTYTAHVEVGFDLEDGLPASLSEEVIDDML